MKSRYTKLTAAAVVLIAVLAGTYFITSFPDVVTPAWAIEQTIDALSDVKTLYMRGMCTDAVLFNTDDCNNPTQMQMWAIRSPEERRVGKSRFERAGGLLIVGQADATYKYYPPENTVYITDPQQTISPWIDGKFMKHVREMVDDWTVSYGVDEETGKSCAFVKCAYALESRSWWFAFDVETKLPLWFKQWDNVQWSGPPPVSIDEISYNIELDDALFEFAIPEGARIVDKRGESGLHKTVRDAFKDPNYGMLTEGLSQKEACVKITRTCWDALIQGQGNSETAEKLWPALAVRRSAYFRGNEPIELIGVGESYEQEGCGIGPVIPCTVKFKNGVAGEFRMIVKFREIDGKESCIIAGTFGSFREISAD